MANKIPSTKTICILLAAGSSSRMTDTGITKPYMKLSGKPILFYSLETLCANPNIDDVLVVIRPEDIELYKKTTEDFDLLPPVVGGTTRQESVHNALEAIAHHSPQYVIVHDASRPFINKKIITSVVKQLQFTDAAIPAIPTNGHIKKCNNAQVLWTIDRTDLWSAQTPQGFTFNKLLQLHKDKRGINADDDSLLWERAGMNITIVPGSQKNINIETDEDYELACEFASKISPSISQISFVKRVKTSIGISSDALTATKEALASAINLDSNTTADNIRRVLADKNIIISNISVIIISKVTQTTFANDIIQGISNTFVVERGNIAITFKTGTPTVYANVCCIEMS